MTETVERAVQVCQQIVKKINQHLWFTPTKNYRHLSFDKQRLGKGTDQDWARLTPENTVLLCSVRVGSTRGVEQWMRKVSKLPDPKFKPLTTKPEPHKLHRVRFSGSEKTFNAHRDFLEVLFRECVECARGEYPSIPPTRKKTAEGAVIVRAPSRWDQDDLAYLRDVDNFDTPKQHLARKEQQFLRRRLLGGLDEGACAICGRTYPITLLVAAHIKRRSKCGHTEKGDPANVVPMCLFGCDALFERGYIGVRNGQVVSIPGPPTTDTVEHRIKELTNRTCAQWTKKNAQYFEWHYTQATKKH